MRIFSVAVLLCLCQLGDYLTTRLGLAAGARERNPLVRRVGLLPTKILAGILTVLPLWSLRDHPILGVYVGAVVMGYGWVIWNNLRVVQRLRRKDD